MRTTRQPRTRWSSRPAYFRIPSTILIFLLAWTMAVWVSWWGMNWLTVLTIKAGSLTSTETWITGGKTRLLKSSSRGPSVSWINTVSGKQYLNCVKIQFFFIRDCTLACIGGSFDKSSSTSFHTGQKVDVFHFFLCKSCNSVCKLDEIFL